VRRLEGAIFQRARDLCLAKGVIMSSDDWKFKFHGRYLPVLHKLPGERGNGWMADNVVIVGLAIVVVSRKREKVVTGERSVLESNQVGIMKCADILLAGGRETHGYTMVFDRGYCDRTLCDKRACGAAGQCMVLEGYCNTHSLLLLSLHSRRQRLQRPRHRGPPCQPSDHGV